jgi:phosphate-selective porin
VKRLIGFALGTLLSLGLVTSASAAGAYVAAPAQLPAGIEVIVVTAKRPAVQPVDAAPAIAEFVVTGKRAASAPVRTPPAMPIEMPKLELAVSAPSVIRL